MGAIELPPDEDERLAALQATRLLDSPAEEDYDRLTRLATQLFKIKTSLVSLVDTNRQWFKSRQGLDIQETGRDISFCSHAILNGDFFEVPDTHLDKRFSRNPVVIGPPYIRFYAAVPITSPSGYKLGTFCILGPEPRTLTPDERGALADFAHAAEAEIGRRHASTAAASPSAANENVRAHAIVDNMLDGILVIDHRGTILMANDAALMMFDYGRQGLRGQRIQTVLPELLLGNDQMAGSALDTEWLSRVIGAGQQTIGLRSNSERFVAEFMLSDFDRDHSRQYICLLRDISERKAEEARTTALAFYDALTGLPNRRLFYEKLEHARVTSRRLQTHAALLFIDLDNFKHLNDKAGHEAGDRLLQLVADRLRLCVRDTDTVARLGGDEFVALLENLGCDARSAASCAEATSQKI